jgi:hypothetical protein
MLPYADVCWRMLTYADVCWRVRQKGEGDLDDVHPLYVDTLCNHGALLERVRHDFQGAQALFSLFSCSFIFPLFFLQKIHLAFFCSSLLALFWNRSTILTHSRRTGTIRQGVSFYWYRSTLLTRVFLLVQKYDTDACLFAGTEVRYWRILGAQALYDKACLFAGTEVRYWRILGAQALYDKALRFDPKHRRYVLTYADVCWRMLTYADVCWICGLVLVYIRQGAALWPQAPQVCAYVCWRMLTYADVCWRMLDMWPCTSIYTTRRCALTPSTAGMKCNAACIYIYIYIHIYIYVYMCVCYKYIHTYIHTYIYTYIHTYIYTDIRIHMFMHMYICMYVYAYILLCVYICMCMHMYLCVCVCVCVYYM